MMLIEKPPQERRYEGGIWSRMKESAAVLAIIGLVGCAHGAAEPRAPPPGPIAMYSVESAEPERVGVGTEVEVLLRPQVRIRDGKSERGITDYETRKGELDLTYCWFVFQEAGYEQDGRPVPFLLNPRFNQPGQQRYIGALLDYGPDSQGMPMQAVVPVTPEQDEPDTPTDLLWSFGKPPQSREEALFFVYPGTVIPIMDSLLVGRLGDYCRETAVPELHVPEFGPTRASFAIYPSRREE